MEKETDKIYADFNQEKYSKDIGYMIKILNDTMEKHANEDFREIGLTFSQIKALNFISNSPNHETTQKELEDFFNVSHPTINGILKRLEEKGKIVTNISVNRRLTKIVHITDEGLEDCKKSESSRLKHESKVSKYLTPEEKETLLLLLKKVYQGMSEE